MSCILCNFLCDMVFPYDRQVFMYSEEDVLGQWCICYFVSVHFDMIQWLRLKVKLSALSGHFHRAKTTTNVSLSQYIWTSLSPKCLIWCPTCFAVSDVMMTGSSRLCVNPSLWGPERRTSSWPLSSRPWAPPCHWEESYPGKPAGLWGESWVSVPPEWTSLSPPARSLSKEPYFFWDMSQSSTSSGMFSKTAFTGLLNSWFSYWVFIWQGFSVSSNLRFVFSFQAECGYGSETVQTGYEDRERCSSTDCPRTLPGPKEQPATRESVIQGSE